MQRAMEEGNPIMESKPEATHCGKKEKMLGIGRVTQKATGIGAFEQRSAWECGNPGDSACSPPITRNDMKDTQRWWATHFPR